MTNTKPSLRFWSLEKVKVRPRSLVEICLRRLASDFLNYDFPTLTKQLGKQVDDLYQYLDLDMPLEAATRIHDENYWKRRTQQYRNAQVGKHGMSWKQTYLELNLEASLEALDMNHMPQDLDTLKKKIQSVRLYIFQLVIKQFRSHADLSILFESLPALASLTITFGDRHLGMDYDRAMFGMKISDAQSLARLARISQTLTSLSLPGNMLDDELVKVLMKGLSFAHMLTKLDMSHNKVGDRGARRLATLLDPDYCLYALDLSDNQIHANGCMHLGAHLAENTTLQSLGLRLNRCEDNGISHLFQDLGVNRHLTTLNISGNDLTQRCIPYLSSMLSENSTLKNLDISANPMFCVDARWEDEDGARAAGNGPETSEAVASDPDSPVGILVKCIADNCALLALDIRNCGCPDDIAQKINTAVRHRYLKSKDIPIEAYEKGEVVEEEAPVEVEESLKSGASQVDKEEIAPSHHSSIGED